MGGAIKDQLGRVQAESGVCPAVILVNPQLGENIGAAARAMLNFGLTDLRLVAPRDGWPNPASEATAAGATQVIENARVYETTADAVADLSFLLAATARRRRRACAMVWRAIRGCNQRARHGRRWHWRRQMQLRVGQAARLRGGHGDVLVRTAAWCAVGDHHRRTASCTRPRANLQHDPCL